MLLIPDWAVMAAMGTVASRKPKSAQVSSALAAIQGSREAQEVVNAMRAGSAPTVVLHRQLEAIRRAGDRVRLQAFTLEIQRALQESQRRTADLRELQQFTDYRARLEAVGVQLYRTDPADGAVTYFSALNGVVRPYVDLGAVHELVATREAAQEGLTRRALVKRYAG